MSYESYLGLVLNMPRIQAQRQAEIATGIAAALVQSPRDVMPLEWFEHLTDNDTEARIWWQQALQDAQAAWAARKGRE